VNYDCYSSMWSVASVFPKYVIVWDAEPNVGLVEGFLIVITCGCLVY
jgi:hypothetical protein